MTTSLDIRRSPELVSSYIHIPDNVDTFEFDTCFIDECFVLKNIAGYIFKQALQITSYELDEIRLTKFIALVCDHYHDNPFHNFQHAVNVLHGTYMLLKTTHIIHKLAPHIIMASLLSALAHDVDHPGNSNSYEINSVSKYARIYNDVSVLENHHCSLAFELMEHTELLKVFKDTFFRDVRKTVIACILGTDMSKHTERLNKLNAFDFNATSFTTEEQIFVASSIVHLADISNHMKPFETSFEWSKRISQEFFEQTVKEEMNNLPSLPFMKVHDTLSMCLNEINFVTNVSLPTWKIFAQKFPQMNEAVDRIHYTLSRWNVIRDKYVSDNDINALNY